MFQGIKGVIFDMDGTLIDSMGIWAKIDHDFLSKRKIPVPPNIQQSIEGKSFTETASYFKERFSLPDTVEAIMAEWVEMCRIYYQDQVPLKPGAKRLIEILHQQGYKMGLGTSSQKDLVKVVFTVHGLQPYFDSIRTSCEVGRGKPFPDIFLKVAEDLQLRPEECLVFEDTLAGITAAKRAGMRVVAVYDEYSIPYMDKIKEVSDEFIRDFDDIAS